MLKNSRFASKLLLNYVGFNAAVIVAFTIFDRAPGKWQHLGWLLLLMLIATAMASYVTFRFAARFQRQISAFNKALESIRDGDYAQTRELASAGSPLNESAHLIGSMQLVLMEREQQLRDNANRLTTVLDSMIEGVIALDAKQRVLIVNNAASSLLTITAQKVVGRPLLEVVRHPAIDKIVNAVFKSQQTQESEFKTIRGPNRTLSMRCSWISSATGEVALLVLHDVTDLRALETMRRDFVANVSHELKTPLSSVKAYAETLRTGAIDDIENRMEFVLRIEEQAERLNRLIMDLIQLARIESGHAVHEITDVDVGDLARQRVEAFREDAENRSITLTYAPAAARLLVRADEEAIRTILDNLITNAIRYTPANGKIDISCRQQQNNLLLEVKDTGIGIAPEHQERIFERFYRVDKARSSDLGGTGLGLSIVKHLAQSFRGQVRVESKLGRGSSFLVIFPMISPETDPSVQTAQQR